MRLWQKLWPPFLPLVAIVFTMEVLVRSGLVAAYLVPAPSQVWLSLRLDQDELLQAAIATFSSAVTGLLLSFVCGSVFAIFISLFSFARRAFYPYAVFFQTVPIIAIAPLLVIWFGFGRPTVVAAAFIVSIFPIIASTLVGLESTDPALMDLFRFYRASRWAVFVKLKLPFALPQILSGMRIGAGLAVIGAIVGEFIAGGGLGSVVDAARTQQRIDKVFACVLVSSLLGLILVSAVDLASWLSLRNWHVSERRE